MRCAVLLTFVFVCALSAVIGADQQSAQQQPRQQPPQQQPSQQQQRQQTGASTQAQPDTPPRLLPDIEFSATIRAKSLKFETVPNVEVKFQPESPNSVFHVERENLPSPIEPNRTYNDIVVRLMISTDLVQVQPQQQAPPQQQQPPPQEQQGDRR